jgi:(1->4)-alpha-D-glucan 1-alpha-D-glucosylmutase
VNDAYFMLQTVVGAYPYAEGSTAWADEENFPKRLRDYITKALQEAKRNTNWVQPNKAYMDAAHAYIDGILDKNGPIWPELADFLARIADFGIVNSLAQVLLKFTTPGVPDVYQGCELFDLSLVDPDNRRAVNYDQREQYLDALSDESGARPMALWTTRSTGQIKLWLTHKLLTERRANPDFWANANYVPLTVSGKHRNHILAFARQHNNLHYVTIVPLHLPRLTRDNPLSIDWQDTRVTLPGGGSWTNVLTKKTGSGAELRLSELFGSDLPMALIRID